MLAAVPIDGRVFLRNSVTYVACWMAILGHFRGPFSGIAAIPGRNRLSHRIANPPSSVRLRPEPLLLKPLRCADNSGLRRGFFVALQSQNEHRRLPSHLPQIAKKCQVQPGECGQFCGQLPDRSERFRSTPTLESIRIAFMTTAEAIYERALALPESLRREALHYLEYLLQRRDAAGQPAADDEAAWTRLTAEQLAAHYGPDDSVYDSP